MSADKEEMSIEISVDELVRQEWKLMADLRKMLADPSLSNSEKIRVANAIAYHSLVINKLLAQKGDEDEFDEESLGQYIEHYAQRRVARIVRRDFRIWKRRLSYQK
jgi:hypothetical protein